MQKTIINATILFIILVIGVGFFWWPKYKDFNNLRLENEVRRIDAENKEKYFLELNNISIKLKEEYGSELAKIDNALPTTSFVPDLLNFLAEKSSQNGLILEKVIVDKISPLEEGSDIKETSLSLALSGFYPAFRDFLSSLQKSAKLIEVDSIIFSESKEKQIFSFNLKIKTYSY